MKPIFIQEANVISPLGFDLESNWQRLLANQSGIKKIQAIPRFQEAFGAQICTEKLEDEFSKSWNDYHCSRIEKMAILALMPLIKNRISPDTLLVLSTTKGNIRGLKQQIESAHLTVISETLKKVFMLERQPIVISNACTSGVLAVNFAKRMIQMDEVKTAFVVAVDEVTEFVLSGFNSFQAMSDEPCRPYDAHRKGVSLGEAACAIYLSSELEATSWNYQILGEGNINDANHISGPSRTGEGLFRSVESAMKEAGIVATDIDYISAHGTATLYNDEMEAIAFHRLGMQSIPLNSLKAYFGHTLGCAGLLELAIACKQMQEGLVIQSLGFEEVGTSHQLTIAIENMNKEIKVLLKTASGFGGTNAAILVKKYAK
ncbi:beta-ketoacyl-[acyl-carrier-protein] synthase family protein [Vaginella massiliensis]|uniref:beta-ketoacyl-[acyl-carrier-protein] synthase family protein n=1 Tax=Vaginella massiliensis TaxID=1816680 RepID=UPI000837E4BF|nr:beta-ketoacyl synthase N-terminal-like domain-containing protein [Vaginella massiliensis]